MSSITRLTNIDSNNFNCVNSIKTAVDSIDPVDDNTANHIDTVNTQILNLTNIINREIDNIAWKVAKVVEEKLQDELYTVVNIIRDDSVECTDVDVLEQVSQILEQAIQAVDDSHKYNV